MSVEKKHTTRMTCDNQHKQDINNILLPLIIISKRHITKNHIYTTEGFVRIECEQNLKIFPPQSLTDLILFFYAKPIIINLKHNNQIKYILYCPLIDSWYSVVNKISLQFNVDQRSNQHLTKLQLEYGQIDRFNFKSTTWNDTDLFYPVFEVYLIECSLCDAKMTCNGSMFDANPSCNHYFVTPGHQKISQRNIGFLTTEVTWLRRIDQNKTENIEHYERFEADWNKLNKHKTTAMQELSSIFKILRAKLDERQQQLQQELIQSFDARQQIIRENMETLKQRTVKYEITKNKSEELLLSDAPEAKREKQIVEICNNIINTTPYLRYIDTELRYTFDQLLMIEHEISEFGQLHTYPINAGPICVFKSVGDSTSETSVKTVKIPIIQFKNVRFDDEKLKIKLIFKLKQTDENGDIDMMKYLQIYVLCAQEMDDEQVDFLKPIHEETIMLKDCKHEKKKYYFYVNKIFNPGITVVFKLKPIFISPNDTTYARTEGKWSRERAYEITEKENE